MNLKSLMRHIVIGILIIIPWVMTSCDSFNEDLPECRFLVKFKYDYNMLYVDAFHTKVDKVELYVFDKNGKFLFKQAEEGASLATGNYLMEVALPVGEYQLMAWVGARDSYDIASLETGVSDITELKLRLKRDESLIIDKELEPLWYGEINKVEFTGTTHQIETINLIKDTNKVRFVFQGYTSRWTINVDDYDYEIIESNGYMAHDNSLLDDDVLSFRPYFKDQAEPTSAVVEMNTMRLMKDRKSRLVVTEKSSKRKVFDINMTNFLAMTNMENSGMGVQEYLDRQDEYKIIFFFSESWLAVQININGWTYHIQTEGDV